MYLIAMGVYVFGAVLWTALGTADVQSWDTYWIKEEYKVTGKFFKIFIHVYAFTSVKLYSM